MLEPLLSLASDSTTLWFAAAALLLFLVAIAVGTATVFRSVMRRATVRRRGEWGTSS